MPQGYKYYVRKWLNKPGYHSTAYILGTIEVFKRDERKDGGWSEYSVDAELSLSDCDRKITLDFFADLAVSRGRLNRDKLAELVNAEHKAITLRDEVISFTDEFLLECQKMRDWASEEVERQKKLPK